MPTHIINLHWLTTVVPVDGHAHQPIAEAWPLNSPEGLLVVCILR